MKPTIHGRAPRLALALALVAGAAAAAAEPVRIHLAQADAAPVEAPVSYSADQADRGEDRYDRECLECHGDDLRGGLNGGAPLRGVNFEAKFANGAPASALYLFMSTLMPPNAPGRYSPNTYADLMAYILKRNGFKAGAPLPSDVDALDNLIMEK
jgi:mono/diheme cytochrome c family protein